MNSVAGKDWYRNVFLKSDEWKLFRTDVLKEQKGHCFVCGKQDASNDVHHVWYGDGSFCGLPQFVVLCRTCHDSVHLMFEPCAARNEGEKKDAYGNMLIAKEAIQKEFGKPITRPIIKRETPKAIKPRPRKCSCCRRCGADLVLTQVDMMRMTADGEHGEWFCNDCIRLLRFAFSPWLYPTKSQAWHELKVIFQLVRNGYGTEDTLIYIDWFRDERLGKRGFDFSI